MIGKGNLAMRIPHQDINSVWLIFSIENIEELAGNPQDTQNTGPQLPGSTAAYGGLPGLVWSSIMAP